jgi:hypothetical protein
LASRLELVSIGSNSISAEKLSVFVKKWINLTPNLLTKNYLTTIDTNIWVRGSKKQNNRTVINLHLVVLSIIRKFWPKMMIDTRSSPWTTWTPRCRQTSAGWRS